MQLSLDHRTELSSIDTATFYGLYLLGLGIGTVFGNMAFLTAIVTSFVSGGFRTVSGDVAHSTTVEATPVLGSGFVNHLSIFSFQACVLAIPCDMSRLNDDDKSKRKDILSGSIPANTLYPSHQLM